MNTIKIKLSDNLMSDYIQRNNMKTVDVISHVLKADSTIKTDQQDIDNTALKDLYIIENDLKLFCNFAYVDTYKHNIELSF